MHDNLDRDVVVQNTGALVTTSQVIKPIDIVIPVLFTTGLTCFVVGWINLFRKRFAGRRVRNFLPWQIAGGLLSGTGLYLRYKQKERK